MAWYVGQWAAIFPKVKQKSAAKPKHMWRMCMSRLAGCGPKGDGLPINAREPNHGHHTLHRDRDKLRMSCGITWHKQANMAISIAVWQRALECEKTLSHNLLGHLWGNASFKA